ncbi:helix-turn-helix domain-containing protein [Schaalia sp. 19OD2882]|uniref:helix-turn-helix domain-containing protein n=1 Tax=Schaalia sp. 19OD2882 TaxID=2794089 RepID=UPI0034674839
MSARKRPGGSAPPPEALFDPEVWYAAREIARRLSVTRQTVDRWCSEGLVRGMKIRGSVRFLGRDLNSLMVPIGPPPAA